MKRINNLAFLALILLSLGCQKEMDNILGSKSSNNRLKSGSALTDEEMDISTFIQVPDYMPANNSLVHNERDELINACVNNTEYRDRTLSEAMFLFEALVNLDINHLPMPLKKFSKEITVFEIAKTSSGNISASSIKSAVLTIGAKINSLGLNGRYVGTIDVEPISISSSSVKIRAVYNTGEPMEPVDGGPPPVDQSYHKPFGDENFLELHKHARHGSQCVNAIPEDNAADDLTGYYYNGGTLAIFAASHTNWFHYVNGSWGLINVIPPINPAIPFLVYNPTYFFNTYLAGLYSYVNLHNFHWSFDKTYSQYRNKPFYQGKFNIPPTSGGSINDMYITIPELHGFSTTKAFDVGSCGDHSIVDASNSGSPYYNKTKRIFFRPAIYLSAGHTVVSNCFSACEMEDFIDAYWDHITDPSVISSLPSHPENNNIVGFQVLPAYYDEDFLFMDGDLVDGDGQADPNPIWTKLGHGEHFIYPAYGKKVFLKEWQE